MQSAASGPPPGIRTGGFPAVLTMWRPEGPSRHLSVSVPSKLGTGHLGSSWGPLAALVMGPRGTYIILLLM